MNQHALARCGALLVLGGCFCCAKKPVSNARGEGPCETERGSAVCIVGAGPEPAPALYASWASEYVKQVPGVRISHELVGADTAVPRLQAGTVDFATANRPLELAAGGAQLQHLPISLGAVAVIYHEAGIGAGLKLSSKALALVLSGRAASWNDPVVADANPDKKLPPNQIVVVPAEAGSGAAESARQYVSRAASEWKQAADAHGRQPAPADGSEDDASAARQVQSTPWSMALVALSQAFVEGVAVAALENRAGRYVAPASDAIGAAVKGVDLPDSLTVSLLETASSDAYPISLFSYVLLPKDARDRTRGEAVLRFLWWASHDGQAVAERTHCAPLPARVVAALEGRLKELKAGGRQVLAGP